MTNDREIIAACLNEFVSILLDGAWDTEGDAAHLDVIALCYVMPVPNADEWGAWASMWDGWIDDGRAPDGVKREAHGRVRVRDGVVFRDTRYGRSWWGDVAEAAEHVAKVIADAVDDGILILRWAIAGEEERDRERLATLAKLAPLAPDHGPRLLDHIEKVNSMGEAG